MVTGKDTLPPEGRDLLANRADSARGHADFRKRLYENANAESALAVLAELMIGAGSAETYRVRREAFLRLCREETPSSAVVARILRYFAVDAPALPFDSRDTLVHAILDHTADEEALVLFLLAMTDQPDSVRPILDRIVTRQNPFPTLTRLLTAPWLESFRHILAAKLLDAARTRQGALRLWVREDPDAFFKPEVFDTLFSQGTKLVGGICKEIIAEGPPEARARLIDRLRRDGSETALRLLILGLPYGQRTCEPELLAALASFQNPLAAAALREVIHRSNVSGERMDEAALALKALQAMNTKEASGFLQEIANRRYALLRVYRRPLRTGAARMLRRRNAS
ncbi:MAG: hypothetical protein ACYTHK_08675 [Planctomycetota bacterium]|jgi:hypothetical protein